LELCQLLKLSKDREVSPDFTSKLMTRLLHQERENTITQVILGMEIGWMMGMASASQGHMATKTRKAYTYRDYINRSRTQSVVRYDVSAGRYTEVD
jgi:hypothetical protein